MCGIIGYVGSEAISNSVLIKGLRAMEYRGYDSAGIAVALQNQITILKTKGKINILEKNLKEKNIPQSTLGIAHTRWATHGEPNEKNAHPHRSGNVTLVHNGIIENYYELREELENAGYAFQSETDSEIAAAYIDYCYFLLKDKQQALIKAYRQFRGSFAFGIIFDDDLTTLYAMRCHSPLVLGHHSNANFIASDITAFLTYTNQYIELDHEEIAVLTKDTIHIADFQGHPVQKEILCTDMNIKDIQKDGYEHFMLKEIHEEPEAVEKTIHSLMQVHVKDLVNTFPNLKQVDTIHIAACGSAYYAGMIAKSIIEEKVRIPVHCVCASEYRYSEPIYTPHTLLILISQSGETADTIAAMQLAKKHHIQTLAIVNVIGSTIAREADDVIYTKAGPEISVATTKAYCTQVTVLSLLACYLADIHEKMKEAQELQITKQISNLPTKMKVLIEQYDYRSFAEKIYKHEHVFFIGRGLDYALSMEGSLKLKEISYIHSEAYAAGELKHGTISLIEKGTPVIALATDPNMYEKTLSNIKEVKARGAYVLLLISDELQAANDEYDDILKIPAADKLIQGMLSVIPLQMLAYETAKLRGCEIDQPRNLAKSVTVE